MSVPEPRRSVIGIRTALIFYALLMVASFATLKGTALVISLVVVLGMAAKSYVHYLRGRLE